MGALGIALKNTKNVKACGLDNIPGQVWKLDDFIDILPQLCNTAHFGNRTDKWRQGCLLTFQKKRR